jgi:hypothetical protein
MSTGKPARLMAFDTVTSLDAASSTTAAANAHPMRDIHRMRGSWVLIVRMPRTISQYDSV